MSTTTPINGFRVPELADAANIENAVGQLASDVDKRAVPIFATTSARNTAIPSPEEGQLSYITSTSSGGRTLQKYNGSAWVRLPDSIAVYKTATESVTSSTTYQNDDHLFLTVQANSTYIFSCWLQIAAHLSGDFKCRFDAPTGATFSAGVIGMSPANTSSAGDALFFVRNNTTSFPTGDWALGGDSVDVTTAKFDGLLIVGATAGTFRLQWAQNASNGTATNVYQHSWMKLERID